MEIVTTIIAGIFSLLGVYLNHYLAKSRDQSSTKTLPETPQNSEAEGSLASRNSSASSVNVPDSKGEKPGRLLSAISLTVSVAFFLFAALLIGLAIDDPDVDLSFFIPLATALLAGCIFFRLSRVARRIS